MRRHVFSLCMIGLLAWFVLQPVALAGSAISVPPEARETAAAAIVAAQDVLDKEQEALYRAEAERYARKAEIEAAEAKLEVVEAEKVAAERSIEADQAAAEAQVADQQAQEAVASAAALGEEAKQALAAAEAAYEAADAIEAALQAKEAAQRQAPRAGTGATAPVQPEKAKQITLEDTDELLKLEKEIREMEKAQKEAELARARNIPMLETPDTSTFDWSEAEAAHAHAERLNRVATTLDHEAEQAERIADEKTALAEEAASKAAEAKQALLDAQLAVNESKENALQTHKYALQTKTELEQLIYAQEHPKGVHFFSAGMNYYRGQDDVGNSFYQFVQPLYFGYWQKDFSYGLSTKHIISQNNAAGARGHVGTLSDTTLTISKRNDKPKFVVDYSISANIPTGKSALSWSERYAMMNEDLVEVSQFGKGWQFTPGIDVSWRIGKEDMWTVGTSYALSGSYDPTSDIPDDNVSPGSEWRRFLRWQHAGQEWKFVGELINTTNGRTQIANGAQYTSGDQWEYRLTYNRKLSQRQNVMFYYWRENQNRNTIVPSDTSNSLVHYFGTMWSKKLDDKRDFRVTFDVMESNGSRYAGVSNYYDGNGNPQYTSIDVDGRTKYTAGLGYDIKVDVNSKFSIDLQAFKMKDGRSTLGQPPTTYKGFNLLMKYNRSI